MQITLITIIVCTLACTANAATYHVSPGGSDLADGLTPATAWATLNKVSAFAYSPGDNILLERGGAWRGKLVANSSGTLGEPITYSSYGDGAKPRILGSDVLNAAGFTLASGTTYELSHATPIGTVLADGTFLNNAWLANGRTTNLTQLRNYVDTNAGSYWYDNLAGRLYLNVGGDPVADGRQFTGVTRDDLVASNGHDHLVFNGLVVDESAIYDRGYGFRIEQSTGVQVLDSEAYRAGKHHFGVINSTGFVGRGLKAQLTMPNLTPGGASALVSFAGASVSDQTSVWDDVEISQTGDLNQAYLSHGSGLGHITLNNIRSYGSPISVSANTTATNLHLENAGIEIGGVGSLVNGARLVGSNANVTFWGDGTAVNLVVDGYFRTRGNASPIVVMEPNNLLAFSTIANAPTGQVDALITFARPQANLEMLGNVISELRGRMIGAYSGTVEDRLVSDYNVYEGAIFKLGWSGPTLTLDQWRSHINGDQHSVVADPKFIDRSDGSYGLQATSPALGIIPTDNLTESTIRDFLGILRNTDSLADIGAFEWPTISADFDRDGDVDGADFLAWQLGSGIASGAAISQGNADADQDVDAADLHAWLQSFAQSHSNAAPIPEPKSLGLLLAALVGAWSQTCRS